VTNIYIFLDLDTVSSNVPRMSDPHTNFDVSRNQGCLTALILIQKLYNKTSIYKALSHD